MRRPAGTYPLNALLSTANSVSETPIDSAVPVKVPVVSNRELGLVLTRHRLADALTKTLRDILQLLLERRLNVELLADGELAIDAVLRYVEVRHIEETVLTNGLDERLRELFLALRGVVLAQIDGDEVCPVEIFLL